MKRLFLALAFIPTLYGYTIKVNFSDGTKTIDTAELDEFESARLSSLFPLIHKVWPKKIQSLDFATFTLLSKLSKLNDTTLFNFFLSRSPTEMKLLYFTIHNCKIANKLRLASDMALLKNPTLIPSENIYQFDRDQFADHYLYDYFTGKVWEAKRATYSNSVLPPSMSYPGQEHKCCRDAFYSKYYGNDSDYYSEPLNFTKELSSLNKFTALLHYHDQTLKKPLAIDTEELKEIFMRFNAQIQNHLVDNKFVALT